MSVLKTAILINKTRLLYVIMGLFDDMLKDSETIFKNELALDFSFHPKPLMFRDKEQRRIALCMKPLFAARDGENMLVYGTPGIGKTVAIKQVFNEIEEKSDEIIPVYINCWQKNTTYKIVMDICETIGYSFVQNKKTEELMKIVLQHFNKSSVAFVFDEIDKAEEYDFLYTFLEQVYKKSIILVSNQKEWLIQLDQRIKSRLNPSLLEFKSYNQQETHGILEQRKDFAFVPNCWENDAFRTIVEKTYKLGDIRVGLHLMRNAANLAENESSRKIRNKHVIDSLDKLSELSPKQHLELQDESEFILNVIKLNSGKKIGELYKIYKENKGAASYKTFQRRIEKLKEGKFINVKKIVGGDSGSTSIVTFQSMKKLTDY